jgi:hypothetical protein
MVSHTLKSLLFTKITDTVSVTGVNTTYLQCVDHAVSLFVQFCMVYTDCHLLNCIFCSHTYINQSLQVESEAQILSTSHMLLVLVELALQNEDAPLCSALSPFIAALTHRLICHGHDPRSCLSVLTRLLIVSPETGSCILMLLTKTIGSCPVIYLKDLVIFCKLFSFTVRFSKF